MHENDSAQMSGSGVTFCGKAFSFLGLHAFWSSAGGGRRSLGAPTAKAVTHAALGLTCARTTTTVSACVLDSSCNNSLAFNEADPRSGGQMAAGCTINPSALPEI